MEQYSQQPVAPDIITVCQAFGAGATGAVVRRATHAVGDPKYTIVRDATASILASSRGPLGVVLGNVDGTGVYLAGAWIRVLWSGLITVAPSVAPAAGDAVYLTDAGVLDSVPGTFRRQVGAYRDAAGIIDFNGFMESRLEEAVTAEGASGQNLQVRNGLRVSHRAIVLAGGATAACDTEDMLYIVSWSGGAGALTLDLPVAPADGAWISISDVYGTAAANNIVVNGNGNSIGPAAIYTINTGHGCLTICYNSTSASWVIISKVV